MADRRLTPEPWAYRPELDGIRAIAITAVVGFHYRADLTGGFLGVSLFFVLSGYLITGLLVDEYRRTGGVDVRAFYQRRARRLLPALIAFLAVTFAVVLVLGHDVGNNVRGSVSALFYFNNYAVFLTGGDVGIYGHLWSLSVEEQYYVVWPLLAAWVLRRWGLTGLRVVAFAVTALAVAATAGMYLGGVEWTALYTGTFNHGACLLGLGSAFALLPADRFRGWMAVVGLVAVGVAFVRVISPMPELYQSGFMLIGVPAALLVAGVSGGSLLGRLLSARPLVEIGMRSYGVYLWHSPIRAGVRGLLPDSSNLALALWSVAVSAVAVELSYRFVERPCRGTRRSERPLIEGRRPAA